MSLEISSIVKYMIAAGVHIEYNLPKASTVRFALYNYLGQCVIAYLMFEPFQLLKQ